MNYQKVRYLTVCIAHIGLILSVGASFMAISSSAAQQTGPIPIQGGQNAVPKSTMIIVETLYGINSSTGKVVAFATVGGSTDGKLLDATVADKLDKKSDGIAEVGLTLTNVTIKSGDKFRACAIVLATFHTTCSIGHKSPSERAEFVDIVINDSNSSSKQLTNNQVPKSKILSK